MQVAAAPCVAIISTGDEVVPPEETPGPGQVRDVNTYTIAGLVTRTGGIPLRKGIIKDDYDSLLSAARNGHGDRGYSGNLCRVFRFHA